MVYRKESSRIILYIAIITSIQSITTLTSMWLAESIMPKFNELLISDIFHWSLAFTALIAFGCIVTFIYNEIMD